MSSASHSQPDPDWKWRKHQPRIRHLFYDKKLKPEEIRDRMRSLDFVPSMKELKDRLEAWGYRRNDTRETREYISHKVEKRDRQNKRSAVVVNGVRWTDTKVRQQTTRNPRKMLEMVRAPSPSTPPGPVVSVCSPIFDDPKAYISFEWSPNLPWLRFTRLVSESPIDILGMMSTRLCRAHSESGVRALTTSGSHSTLQIAARQLGLSNPEDISNPLKLSTYLQSIMPESCPGEHLLRSQHFAKGFEIAALEILSLVFYQLSNRAISNNERSNELLVDIISQSGLVGLNHPIFAEPTIRSALEEVGLAALCCCRSEIVTWILDVGIDLAVISHHSPLVVAVSRLHDRIGRDRVCPSGRFCRHSDLVSNHDGMATIRVLLAHGVSSDKKCCDEHGTPLEAAIRDGLLDIVEVYVDHGRITHGPEYFRNMDFSRLFLLPHWNIPLEEEHSMLDYILALFHDAFQAPSDPFGALLSADGLIKAALYGGQALLNTLYSKGANFNCKNLRGEHPLGVVVASRKRLLEVGEANPWRSSEEIERCKALVALGAMVDYGPIRGDGQGNLPSAIHVAALMGDTDALGAFLEIGPCQHTPASFYVDGYWLYDLKSTTPREEEHEARSPLGWSLWRRSHGCARLLLKSGCPVEGHELLLLTESIRPGYHHPRIVKLATALVKRGIDLDLQTSSGKTALDIAISKEQFEIANVLILGGATKNIAISMAQSDALGTCGWLDHFKPLNFDDWCRLYPCESITSQNSRLGDLSQHLHLWKPAHITRFKFVLERYHRAYSSIALQSCLSHMNDFVEEDEIWTLTLQTIYELLRRRRPEFVTPKAEILALDMLMEIMYDTESDRLLGVLEVLLQQDPGLGHMDSYPWENPLCWVSLLGVKMRERVSNEAMKFYGSVKDLLLGSGFTANSVVGLKAIGEGCTTDQLENLLHHGYNPRKRYRWSNTALQLAAMNDDLDMVRYLLNHEVNVNGRPRWGERPWVGDYADRYTDSLDCVRSPNRRTAFQYAVENNNWECTQLLFEFGADVNAPPATRGGATALQLAAMKGYIRLVRWLISEDAEILAQGAPINGMTAIEGAAASGKLDVVGLLFEYGNFCDGEGRHQCIRAVGYARKEKYEALRSFMEDHIAWSQADEDMLAGDDLLESFNINNRHWATGTNHPGCDGETESVDEGMDEPECCCDEVPMDSSDSEDGESVYSDRCVSENEHISTAAQKSNSCGGHHTAWIAGESRPDVAAQAHNVGFDGFWETNNIGNMDLGFLPDSYPGYEVSDAPGLVIGEVFGNEEWLDGPMAPALHYEWIEPDNQGGWIAPGDDISGNQLDFSEFL